MRLRLGASGFTFEAPMCWNVRRLAPLADDIELILYDTGTESSYPDADESAFLRETAARYGCTYTVHLPSALGAHPLDRAWEAKVLEQWSRSVESCESLNPFAYIWHWESEIFGPRPAEDTARWLEVTARTASAFTERFPELRSRLCVENLSYDFRLAEPLISELRLPVCLDIGHAWRGGWADTPFLERLLPQAKIIHMHGVNTASGQDHIALREENRAGSESLFAALRRISESSGLERVLTFEVFSWADWRSCRRFVSGWIPEERELPDERWEGTSAWENTCLN